MINITDNNLVVVYYDFTHTICIWDYHGVQGHSVCTGLIIYKAVQVGKQKFSSSIGLVSRILRSYGRL
jgi:hypothetical protein